MIDAIPYILATAAILIVWLIIIGFVDMVLEGDETDTKD